MKDLLPDVLGVASLVLDFGRVERATFHQDGFRPESDTDHTVMLGVVACALACEYNRHKLKENSKPGSLRFPRADQLDVGLIAQFCLVHDLVEALAGDTDMLNPSAATTADKERREKKALTEIRQQTKRLPWISATIALYDEQDCRESRFVRAVDKIMPKLTMMLNHGAGVVERQDPAQVPVINQAQIVKLRSTYAADMPEVVELLEAACAGAEKILAGPKCEEAIVLNGSAPTQTKTCGAPASFVDGDNRKLCIRCASFVTSRPISEVEQ